MLLHPLLIHPTLSFDISRSIARSFNRVSLATSSSQLGHIRLPPSKWEIMHGAQNRHPHSVWVESTSKSWQIEHVKRDKTSSRNPISNLERFFTFSNRLFRSIPRIGNDYNRYWESMQRNKLKHAKTKLKIGQWESIYIKLYCRTNWIKIIQINTLHCISKCKSFDILWVLSSIRNNNFLEGIDVAQCGIHYIIVLLQDRGAFSILVRLIRLIY